MERGRPSVYTQKIADEICRHLANGLTLREVCRAKGMPTESTVRSWALDDYRGFSAHYARAREIGYLSLADELLEVADDGTNDWTERQGVQVLDGEHVQRSRLRVDTRKWLLSKALPKVFGDKIMHAGADGGALQIVISSDDAKL